MGRNVGGKSWKDHSGLSGGRSASHHFLSASVLSERKQHSYWKQEVWGEAGLPVRVPGPRGPGQGLGQEPVLPVCLTLCCSGSSLGLVDHGF